ncbi:MAG: serine--tRNA ligase [Bacteroidales bacterium]|jgi:seryl-tRNA synthetase|nr:serine--tRNA ligase [Bacteroidales bacterium]MDD2824329.1 serine--tRNA ligase [Bacteroidales bacterium]MDD3100747.1 serine--tRNA ligase [Bacteroidales bacterium]MDD3639801.1 serine--tRNA ligase [Bacteroidales bacterium]MDD3944367.1 serine--tRNA ligase [Bacteroidales bacterium]
MLTLKLLREDPGFVIERLAVKNFDAGPAVHKILDLDARRRAAQTEADALTAEQKKIASQIGRLMQEGKKDEAGVIKRLAAESKEKVKELIADQDLLERELNEILVTLPNLPYKMVVPGKGAEDNVLVREGGSMPLIPDDALPHWELAKKYDLIDFDLGVKLTGAGFPVYKGKGARLQMALIQFFLDQNTRAGFREIMPPILVNEDSGYGTGQLPDKGQQMYHVGLDNYYLIPTAEVPLTNIYRDTILDAGQLPVRLTAYTPCFRREAGSYGKDVRGLNRLHQFDKVEIVQLTHPENSYSALDQMVKHVERLVQLLKLPYRILRLCGADLSFTSAMTYDFEVYSAAQQRWLEVSSVSNFETFQSNRLKARFRGADGKPQLVHTLNGSALALPRIVAALLENNQTPEGIMMPDSLHKYLHFSRI